MIVEEGTTAGGVLILAPGVMVEEGTTAGEVVITEEERKLGHRSALSR